MGGLLIVLLTLLAVTAFVALAWASQRGLETLNVLYNDTGRDEHLVTKMVLLIPYILLTIWVFLLHIVLFAGAFMAVVSFANSARNWWHRGPKGR